MNLKDRKCDYCDSKGKFTLVAQFSVSFGLNLHGKLCPREDMGDILHMDNLDWSSIVMICDDCGEEQNHQSCVNTDSFNENALP